MDPGFITLMRKLAPDLIDEITRRALILERIAVMQPVGRRQLAAKLNLPEREIRNTAAILKDLGYIRFIRQTGELEEAIAAVCESPDRVYPAGRIRQQFASLIRELTDADAGGA